MKQMDEVKAQIRVEELALAAARPARRGRRPERSRSRARPVTGSCWRSWPRSRRKRRPSLVPNEFDRIYTAAGASGMNAGTTEDFTIYFINVPANKLELWFWMESDRLLNPVFREFYSERDVVHEERRMRIESTPTGKFDEQFDALFWTLVAVSLAGGWLAERPRRRSRASRREAYFGIYYAPNNLTACLVGDFDPARGRRRWPRSTSAGFHAVRRRRRRS